jgi:N-glycosylase/DNA lyase
MSQTATILTQTGAIQIELPDANLELMTGVRWGALDAFPTPAYFACQVLARRLLGRAVEYRLGRTLTEEVAACLLGGHGIPARVGLVAYEHLRARGAFSGSTCSREQLEAWLAEPLQIESRVVRYRFAAQKARYLAEALPLLKDAPRVAVGRELRDWLLRLPGIGPKTASWIARNWLSADDVAILDIHIVRVGQAVGLFPRELTVERHYLELERLFLEFSSQLDVRASELDAVIWFEMASSPLAVRSLLEYLRETDNRSPSHARQRQRARPAPPLRAPT